LADYAEPDERIALDQEMLQLAVQANDKIDAARAQTRLVIDYAEKGDTVRADETSRAFAELARALGRPRYAWQVAMFDGMWAVREGRFSDADASSRAAKELARRMDDPSLEVNMACQEFARSLVQGRSDHLLDELPPMERMMAQLAEGEVWAKLFRALSHARLGDESTARHFLDGVPSDATVIRVEPPGIRMYGEACLLLEDRDGARVAYDRLLRYEKRMICWGQFGCIVEGPYSWLLGALAGLLGRGPRAVAHFEEAISQATTTGSHPALARTYLEYAAAMIGGVQTERTTVPLLLAKARALAERLNMPWLLTRIRSFEARMGPSGADDKRPTDGPVGVAPSVALNREGEYWTLTCKSGTFRLRDSRGLQILAHLLEHPEREVHVLALGTHGDPGELGDAGDVLDAEATRSYRARVEELRDEEREAEGWGDAARLSRVREEMETLARELAGGIGLGGRHRKAAAVAERARVNVQRRVRDAIRKIEECDKAVGQYLGWTIHTGTFCVYRPGHPPAS
jgi:hypothetical protein